MSNSPILSVAALLVAGLAICLQLLGTGESAPAPAPVSRGLEPAAELLARLGDAEVGWRHGWLRPAVDVFNARVGGVRILARAISLKLKQLTLEKTQAIQASRATT